MLVSAFASIRVEMISERAFCVARINAVRPSYYSVLRIDIVMSQ
jgi:hypothetical protein